MPDAWFVIIKPQCHVDTGKIFSANDLTRDSKSITISGFNSGDNQNDCSAVVRKRYIEVEQALDGLDEYGQARLTGIGACVLFSSVIGNQHRMCIVNWLQIEVYIAQGLAISPLHKQMGELFNF